MTLGESNLLEGILVNDNQFGWWLVPIRDLPSQSEELGILQISDQGGSWMKMILNWLWVSRMVLIMREFLQTFCEKILRFFTIIIEVSRSPKNKSTWTCFHGSQCTSFIATPYWICVSRMDIDWNQLGDLLGSLNTWMSEDIALLSLFQVAEGWTFCLPCNTTQIHDGF